MNSIPTAMATSPDIIAIHLAGCTSQTSTSRPETTPPPPTDDAHAGHAHPAEGPHLGDLIELGNEEYHAELLHDENSVTIYILNGAADKQVPIAAAEIIINAKHDGQPEQFKLVASPDTSDSPGQASRFVSNDPELAGHIDEDGADPRLVLGIGGKSYRGEIKHDHAGHDHAGHNH